LRRFQLREPELPDESAKGKPGMSETDRGDVLIESELCKGCLLCLAACPPAVLAESRLLNRQGYYAVTYLGSGCPDAVLVFTFVLNLA
jgi:ferredoxin